MLLFGLHLIDILIVAAFLVAILAIGFWTSRGVSDQEDFFLNGRKMGGLLQFFLSFGPMADSNNAPTLASEVYREGIGGIWISFQLLLMTPFYWFSSVWFRRARQVTYADLFTDRFGSRRLAGAFAAIGLLVAILNMGLGNIVSYKVVAALLVKPESAWTASERNSVENYRLYRNLAAQSAQGALSPDDKKVYAVLLSKERRGELTSYVSYIRPLPFYIGYTLLVGTFIVLGGIKAAALTDAVQGVLVIFFSLILVPLGISHIGGFHVLHTIVEASKFDLINQEGGGDYTWYSVSAIVLFGILGLAGMSGGAAARNEHAARSGALAGAFVKRVLTLPWAFCGLLALAILGPNLSDPDAAWGRLSSTLLTPGLLGLMLSGMLLGHMPAVGGAAVGMSALISRNLYEPLFPGRPDGHYLRVAKGTIFLVLGLGMVTSLFFSGVVSMMFTIWLFGAILSATLVLLYFWRGLTVRGIALSWLIWTIMVGAIPWLVPQVPAFRHHPSFLLQTESPRNASAAFMAQPLFFDSIARIHPDDPLSASEGIGRFNVENYLLYHLGVPLQRFNSAGLMTARWLFDSFMPFLLLMGLSRLLGSKSPEEQVREDRFFAKIKTPIGPTPEHETQELELSRRHPSRFDHLKLFPGTAWEFTKWSRHDLLGFAGCWLLVFGVLALLWEMVSFGA